jgi:hypothetical protein
VAGPDRRPGGMGGTDLLAFCGMACGEAGLASRLRVVTVTVAGGPDWADIMTAFGTVGAVVVAVGIALWSGRSSRKAIDAEHVRGDRQLEDERAHSRAQIEDERGVARDREQLAGAYAVQVVLAERRAEKPDTRGEMYDDVEDLAVMVVNRGSFTVTQVEVRFSLDGKCLVPHGNYVRLSGFIALPEKLREHWLRSDERAAYGVLTPWDMGIRFESAPVHVQNLKSPYALVRWRDRWGTRWEHRLGEVRKVGEGEDWAP